MAKRLFVAVELPEAVKARVVSIAQGLAGARWVKPEHVHLTLRFIGDAEDFLYEKIREQLAEVHGLSLELELVGAGCFPPRGVPRVVWVGVSPLAELEALYRQIETILVAVGVVPERRPFRPHITLARLAKTSQHDVTAYLKDNSGFKTGPFSVTSFKLFSSVLTPQGPIHTVEASYPLISSSP